MSRVIVWMLGSLLAAGALAVASCSHTSPTVDAMELGVAAPDSPRDLIQWTTLAAEAGATRVHPDYIRATLRDRASDAAIDTAFERALGEGTEAARRDLIAAIERKFVHDPKASGLDLLGEELSAHFRNFDWQEADYPGGPPGPNEAFADVMCEALDLVVPERRANSKADAVVVRAQATDAVWDYILAAWTPVPEAGDWKLNKHAVDPFVRMRAAAAADGVVLGISSAHRDPKRAAANAARVGNPNAVASFSSHSLGLAIDFKLSQPGAEYPALATSPMIDVVKMRESPIHKWLCLHAHKYGWYPFQLEPWHWEYNPPGFRPTFWSEFQGEIPPLPDPTPAAGNTGPMPPVFPGAATSGS